MPLSVDIKINGRLIETVHIGRGESLKSENSVHNYVVTEMTKRVLIPEHVAYRYTHQDVWPAHWVDQPDWDLGVPFQHKYSDGSEVCVIKALEALRTVEGRKPV